MKKTLTTPTDKIAEISDFINTITGSNDINAWPNVISVTILRQTIYMYFSIKDG